ncbi:hypothetical protein KIPB_014512, partial [Kipferlia bialata]|eukprot:g14512.t1
MYVLLLIIQTQRHKHTLDYLLDVALALCEGGADPNVPNRAGKTPLCYLVSKTWDDWMQEMALELIDMGASD